MTHTGTTSVFKKAALFGIALLCAGSLLFIQAPQVHAAGLTSVQINAVIGLLQAFDVPQATIDNVKIILNDAAAPTQTTTPPATQTTAPVVTPTTATAASSCGISGSLSQGSQGVSVEALQNFLVSQGLMSQGDATGYFGPITEAAVKYFQQQSGVQAGSAAGTVGPQTQAVIAERCGTTAPAVVYTPSQTSSAGENGEAQGSDSNTAQTTVSSYTGPHVPSAAVCMSQDPTRDNAEDRYMNPDMPTVKEFMDATGASFSDTTPVLGLGRMKDFRDWKAIMASADPLNAARQATAALYNSGRTDYVWWQACRIEWLPKVTILATTQNFTFYKDEYPSSVIYRVGITDTNGYLIHVPANSFVLFKNIRDSGLDASQLTSLQAQLDAKGIDQTKISSWPRNFKDSSISMMPAYNLMAAIGMTVLSPYEWAVENLANALFEAGIY